MLGKRYKQIWFYHIYCNRVDNERNLLSYRAHVSSVDSENRLSLYIPFWSAPIKWLDSGISASHWPFETSMNTITIQQFWFNPCLIIFLIAFPAFMRDNDHLGMKTEDVSRMRRIGAKNFEGLSISSPEPALLLVSTKNVSSVSRGETQR